MRSRPQSPSESGANLSWGIELQLQLLEEVVLGPHVSRVGAPGKEEAWERVLEALERGDKKAEEEASKAYARGEVWEWWKAFREKRLLRDLFELGARRSEARGSRRKRKKIRRPTHDEGRRVAEAMLADIPDARRLNRDWESAIVSADLATPSPLSVFSPEQLPEYIKRAEESRVYFDAVERIEEKAKNRDEDISRPPANDRQQAARRRRKRPAMNPLERGRPLNPVKLIRDMQIQFTIEVVKRVGIPPQGTRLSGCLIVSEVLGMPVKTVEDIWKEPLQKTFVAELLRHSKAIADRTGPFHTTED